MSNNNHPPHPHPHPRPILIIIIIIIPLLLIIILLIILVIIIQCLLSHLLQLPPALNLASSNPQHRSPHITTTGGRETEMAFTLGPGTTGHETIEDFGLPIGPIWDYNG